MAPIPSSPRNRRLTRELAGEAGRSSVPGESGAPETRRPSQAGGDAGQDVPHVHLTDFEGAVVGAGRALVP
jgi:hypothetical protein